MIDYALPYGNTSLTITLPDDAQVDELMPQDCPGLENPVRAIESALNHPAGGMDLRSFANIRSVGIAINDKTRPVAQPDPLPLLLRFLENKGIAREKIILFVGSGTHQPMASHELPLILDSDIIRDYTIVCHDCDHTAMIDLGTTTYNTPVRVNKAFFCCDLKITVGNIEPHHFMGFSGGVKTAAIGLASRETIDKNHAMLIHDRARTGIYDDNPMRQDVEEIGAKMAVHFCLSSILNEQHEIIRIYCGPPENVMAAAIPAVRKVFGVLVAKPYDLVIASPGGAPKDINLYQAQKGLTHAAAITKRGGWTVLLAACTEGSGSRLYEDYIHQAGSHQAVLDDFASGFFKVGPHKAFQIAKAIQQVNFVLISDLHPDDVRSWRLAPCSPNQRSELIQHLLSLLPQNARIAILPAATRTMLEETHV